MLMFCSGAFTVGMIPRLLSSGSLCKWRQLLCLVAREPIGMRPGEGKGVFCHSIMFEFLFLSFDEYVPLSGLKALSLWLDIRLVGGVDRKCRSSGSSPEL
jgi:hypothetical protein